jgi:UPF0042 nucleotide-binding protein
VLDLRRETLLTDLEALLMLLQEQHIPLIFLEAEDAVLVRRLSANRRRHPYALSAGGGVLEGIEQERSLLNLIRSQSTHVLDTSHLTSAQLLLQLEQQVLGAAAPLSLTLISFGFKYGVPVDANLMFDVRFLVNPYFVPHLRLLTGQDPELQSFLFADPLTQQTYEQIRTLVIHFLPAYQAERRSHLTIAIGCTGGQHRSVTLIERLAQELAEPGTSALQLQVVHRHLSDSQRELAALFGHSQPTDLSQEPSKMEAASRIHSGAGRHG